MKPSIFIFSVLSSFAVAAEEPVKLGALTQAWMFNDTSVTAAKPNFRLRRAEIKISSTLSEEFKAFMMVDAARALSTTNTTVSTPTGTATVTGLNSSGDNKLIQDLGITVLPCENLEITLGQFKTPTTAEGLESSGDLIFPERSIVGRTFGDKREPGAMIAYKYSILKTSLMFSNGQAANVDDVDNNKDITLRLNAEVNSELTVGGFTQAANFSYGERARHGLNVRYQTETLLARLEGVYQSANQDSVKSNGLVVDGGYKLDKWQPVIRYEMYNPNTTGSQTGKAVSLGLNYYFTPKAKAQFATTGFWDMNASNGTLALSSAALGTTGTLMTLALSAAL